MPDDFVTLTTSISVDEAEGIRLLLAQEGIEAMVVDGNTVTANWFLGPAVGYIKVQVPKSQADAALAILKQHPISKSFRETDTEPPAACLQCGAPMPEDSETCPKCGWTYDVAEPEEETDDVEDPPLNSQRPD